MYELIDGAIYFPSLKLLALSDLHVGYEADLRRKGMRFPAKEFPVLERRVKKILAKTMPEKIVINGDFKHEFGRINNDEWRQAKKLMDLMLSYGEVVLIAGNHDVMLGPLAGSKGLKIEKYHIEQDILFMHGDKLPEADVLKEAKTIIIGHQHPAIGITYGARTEVVKCYLKGSYKRKKLIVLPSMFSLTEGADLLKEKIISPFLNKIDNFDVIALIEGEILPFGKVKDIRKLE